MMMRVGWLLVIKKLGRGSIKGVVVVALKGPASGDG